MNVFKRFGKRLKKPSAQILNTATLGLVNALPVKQPNHTLPTPEPITPTPAQNKQLINELNNLTLPEINKLDAAALTELGVDTMQTLEKTIGHKLGQYGEVLGNENATEQDKMIASEGQLKLQERLQAEREKLMKEQQETMMSLNEQMTQNEEEGFKMRLKMRKLLKGARSGI